ncbi:MAG: histidinol-phosphate phosphatase family protein [Bacteroidia bacterium]|jgi:histidinol-phosphate phosphatase family protein
MQEHKKYLPSRAALKEYTLFIDRDGVINEPIVDNYAKRPEDFILCKGAIDALGELYQIFDKVILVTNQQGIHRGLMSESDLEDVHLKMYKALKNKDLPYFDAAFFAPYLSKVNHPWRKPHNGMLRKAQNYFEGIDFSKAIMVGDSPGDMKLADSLEILKVRINNPQFEFDNQDVQFDSLSAFVYSLSN